VALSNGSGKFACLLGPSWGLQHASDNTQSTSALVAAPARLHHGPAMFVDNSGYRKKDLHQSNVSAAVASCNTPPLPHGSEVVPLWNEGLGISSRDMALNTCKVPLHLTESTVAVSGPPPTLSATAPVVGDLTCTSRLLASRPTCHKSHFAPFVLLPNYSTITYHTYCSNVG
jgi:hypothetical protein